MRGVVVQERPVSLPGQLARLASFLGIKVDLLGKVFFVSSLVILVFMILTLALQKEVAVIFDTAFNFLTGHLGNTCWMTYR
ncbi:hypothetical protein OM427_07300 [Halomonas sp. 18H]|uniref:hypothetical protein n=1 Tax=Halomonas almeriensis TaxID=308163 RepID=UPI0022300C20|nr:MULTISPECIES: hypothetical protein [Halomonas]MCW4149336.1 hypothetical protein [Halomonas sp. 18H]MDN3553718.1 hypothetical protein [Halomonas almeriensis]